MNDLRELENRSLHIIREAVGRFKNPAAMWSVGKDSTALLWLVKKAFYGKVPFPIIHIDTGYKFKEMYAFRDRIAKEWGMELLVAENKKAKAAGVCPEKGRLECCTQLKTQALKDFLEEKKFDALFLAIRRDEHGIRAKERAFSPRDEDFKWDYKNQPPEMWDLFKGIAKGETHMRVHPILHWTEFDIWRFVQQENIPVNPLYFAKEHEDGTWKRYRSLGCVPCTNPVESKADTIDKIVEELRTTDVEERSGRCQDKENAYTMAKLRALGYM